MADIAKHIRIFSPNPSDDYVSKRITAVTAIESAIKKKTTPYELFEFANGLITALENSEVANEVVNRVSVPALKKSSTAFVADDESLQLLVCTLLATLQYLEKTKGFAQKPSPEFILAVALWSGLSFQAPIKDKGKLELLRTELLQTAQKIAVDVANTSRLRKETKLRVAIEAPTENTWAAYTAATDSSYGKLVDALRVNSYLDREEIDILWWVLGNWSGICQVQMSTLNNVQSCFVASIEIGKLLRRFPAQAHTHLACRGTNQNDAYSGAQILEQAGEHLETIKASLNAKEAENTPKIFPVSKLIAEGIADAADPERTLHEWASRLLVEISLTNINKFVE